MSVLAIKDLAGSNELDRAAMAEVVGGEFLGFPSIRLQSPDIFNQVTPINNLAAISTLQANHGSLFNATDISNGNGVVYAPVYQDLNQNNSSFVSDVNKSIVV